MDEKSYKIGSLTLINLDTLLEDSVSEAERFTAGVKIASRDYTRLVKYYLYKNLLDLFKDGVRGPAACITSKPKTNPFIKDVSGHTGLKVLKPLYGTLEDFVKNTTVDTPEYDDMVSENIDYSLSDRLYKLRIHFEKNGLKGLVSEYSTDNAKLKLFK